jgi:hypothetical protein
MGDGSVGTTHYQVFDENGSAVGDTAGNTDDDLSLTLDDLMCEDNCRLSTNADVQGKGFVITLSDNDDSAIATVMIDDGTNFVTATFTDAGPAGLDDGAELSSFVDVTPVGAGAAFTGPATITQGSKIVTATFTDAGPAGLDDGAELTVFVDTVPGDAAAFTGDESPLSWQTASSNLGGVVPVTVTEQGPNSGVFGTFDESDSSNVVITGDAKRGTSASIDYNESPVTILVGLSFGSVDIMPIDDEWSSGEEIPIEVMDNDANKNSRADEDLDLNNPDVDLIPSLQTGSPATLSGLTAATIDGIAFTGLEVQDFSDRALLVSPAATAIVADDDLVLTFGTMNDFFDAAPINDADFQGFALFNYDVRSLTDNVSGIDSFDILIGTVQIATGTTDDQGLILINSADADAIALLSGDLDVTFNLNGASMGALDGDEILPVVADIFGFGFTHDG